jgi:hypothetical protein
MCGSKATPLEPHTIQQALSSCATTFSTTCSRYAGEKNIPQIKKGILPRIAQKASAFVIIICLHKNFILLLSAAENCFEKPFLCSSTRDSRRRFAKGAVPAHALPGA